MDLHGSLGQRLIISNTTTLGKSVVKCLLMHVNEGKKFPLFGGNYRLNSGENKRNRGNRGITKMITVYTLLVGYTLKSFAVCTWLHRSRSKAGRNIGLARGQSTRHLDWCF